MAIDVHIKGGLNSKPVKVTPSGELVVAPLSYDLTKFNLMNVANTSFSYYEPLSNKQFIVKSIIVFADRSINDANSTVIEIYESQSPDSIDVDKTILKFGMAKLSVLPIVPLNILVSEGVWLNAKTDDTNILLTITGNYIDVI